MEPRQKAIELVKALEKELDSRDIYWNATEDAKACAKIAVDTLCDGSEYWQQVKIEIELLPDYAEDF